ncbi:MAG: protein kinase domain-containing protein [Pseudomonadales bacterium]
MRARLSYIATGQRTMCDIFISYSHQDKELLDELRNFLKPLEKRLSFWSDQDISAGADWDSKIQQEIKNARIALLLVSPDFLASDYIVSKELSHLVQAAENGRVKLAVLYLKTSLVSELEIDISHGEKTRKVLLTKYQGLNSPQDPVASIDERDADKRNQLYLRISQKLAVLANSIASPLARFSNSNEVVDEVREKLRKVVPNHLCIGHTLFRGNSSLVYYATDKNLDRPVAVKVMDPSKLSAESFEQRLQDVRLAADFKSRSIMSVYSTVQRDRLLYTVMEYIDGITLADLNRKVGIQPFSKSLPLIERIGDALEYIHLKGYVHGHLYPSNVMLDHEGWPTISPFKILYDPDDMKSNGLISLETIKYQSPEQYEHVGQVTAATDQYSLGLIAWELIAGEPMIRAERIQDVIAAKNQTLEIPPSLVTKRANCPQPLAAAIEKMLQNNPQDRWPTLGDALAAICVAAEGVRESIQSESLRCKHALVIASYERLRSKREFFQAFYARFLLKLDDDIKAKFPMHMDKQYRMLREAIDLLLWFPAETTRGVTSLTKLSIAHANILKLDHNDYDQFQKCLLLAVEEHDPDCDKDLEKAWQATLAPGVDYMKSFVTES